MIVPIEAVFSTEPVQNVEVGRMAASSTAGPAIELCEISNSATNPTVREKSLRSGTTIP